MKKEEIYKTGLQIVTKLGRGAKGAGLRRRKQTTRSRYERKQLQRQVWVCSWEVSLTQY